jgi:membrane protein
MMRGRLPSWLKGSAWPFLLSLYQRFSASKLTLLAAALAFYAAFSLGPLLLLLAGGLGYLLQNRPELAAQYQEALVNLVTQVMPLQDERARVELVEESFRALLLLLQEGALLRGALSLLVLLWASSNFFASLQLALEVVFASPSPRVFWRKRLVALLLVLIVVVVIGFEVVGGILVSYLQQLVLLLERFLEGFNLPDAPALPFPELALSELLRAAIAALAFTLCFKYLPRRSSTWPGAVTGALFATLSILLVRELFRRAFNLERFNLIFGVITSLLFVLFWLYFAMLLFLVGALLAAEISARQRRGAPVTHDPLPTPTAKGRG